LKPLDPTALRSALRRVTRRQGRLHVLLVDDDPHVADLLHQTLPDDEFELETASDGVEGLEAIARRRPDVLLLDIIMPRLDGFGVIDRLRSDPATHDLPIVVMSAKQLTDDETRRLEESVHSVVRKQALDREQLMRDITGAAQGGTP